MFPESRFPRARNDSNKQETLLTENENRVNSLKVVRKLTLTSLRQDWFSDRKKLGSVLGLSNSTELMTRKNKRVGFHCTEINDFDLHVRFGV